MKIVKSGHTLGELGFFKLKKQVNDTGRISCLMVCHDTGSGEICIMTQCYRAINLDFDK